MYAAKKAAAHGIGGSETRLIVLFKKWDFFQCPVCLVQITVIPLCWADRLACSTRTREWASPDRTWPISAWEPSISPLIIPNWLVSMFTVSNVFKTGKTLKIGLNTADLVI